MRTLLFSALLLFVGTAHAAQKTVYVLHVEKVNQAEINNVKQLEKKITVQPFWGTYLLAVPNTNYMLFMFTEQVVGEKTFVDNQIALGTFEIYQTYIMENNRVWLDVDNSLNFDVSKDWSKPSKQ